MSPLVPKTLFIGWPQKKLKISMYYQYQTMKIYFEYPIGYHLFNGLSFLPEKTKQQHILNG